MSAFSNGNTHPTRQTPIDERIVWAACKEGNPPINKWLGQVSPHLLTNFLTCVHENPRQMMVYQFKDGNEKYFVSPLAHLVFNGRLDLIKKCISSCKWKKGYISKLFVAKDASKQGKPGHVSLLQFSIILDQYEIYQYLLNTVRCNVNVMSEDGTSLLALCATHHNPLLLAQLLFGPKNSKTNAPARNVTYPACRNKREGFSPLDRAISLRDGLLNMMLLLEKYDSTIVNVRCRHGGTSLLYLAEYASVFSVGKFVLMMAYDADVHTATKDNLTVEDTLASYNHPDWMTMWKRYAQKDLNDEIGPKVRKLSKEVRGYLEFLVGNNELTDETVLERWNTLERAFGDAEELGGYVRTLAHEMRKVLIARRLDSLETVEQHCLPMFGRSRRSVSSPTLDVVMSDPEEEKPKKRRRSSEESEPSDDEPPRKRIRTEMNGVEKHDDRQESHNSKDLPHFMKKQFDGWEMECVRFKNLYFHADRERARFGKENVSLKEENVSLKQENVSLKQAKEELVTTQEELATAQQEIVRLQQELTEAKKT